VTPAAIPAGARCAEGRGPPGQPRSARPGWPVSAPTFVPTTTPRSWT